MYVVPENKGADQLHDYRAAYLRLCFGICKSKVSHDMAHVCNVSSLTSN